MKTPLKEPAPRIAILRRIQRVKPPAHVVGATIRKNWRVQKVVKRIETKRQGPRKKEAE
jgi:hypothetical protein